MRVNERTIAGLRCLTVDARPANVPPQRVAVFCHGYGATGDDLASLAPALLEEEPALEPYKFVFPEAPLTLEALGMPEGRAWWHLDLYRLQSLAARGDLNHLRSHVPDGLLEARTALTGCLEALSAEHSIPLTDFVLGGFSQGAMLATDVSLHLPQRLAGLVIWSGTLIAEKEWQQQLSIVAPRPVLISHGRFDPILPFAGSELLRDMFTAAKFPVEYLPFSGQHQLTDHVLTRTANLLREAHNPPL